MIHSIGLKAAQEQGIEVNFENQEFLDLMKEKTAGVENFQSRL